MNEYLGMQCRDDLKCSYHSMKSQGKFYGIIKQSIDELTIKNPGKKPTQKDILNHAYELGVKEYEKYQLQKKSK